MTDRHPIPEAVEEAYEEGIFKADMYVQSLHDHGAAMSQQAAYTAFNEILSELIGEGAATEGDTVALKRLEGFACRTGGLLWQLVCQGGTDTPASQATGLIRRVQAPAVRPQPHVAGQSDFQRGALRFKSLLIELHALHRRHVEELGNDNPVGFMRALVDGMVAPACNVADTGGRGFMLAFAVWMESTVSGAYLVDPERWDVLAEVTAAAEGGAA